MSEQIGIPPARRLPKPTYYRLDERPCPSQWAAERAEPVRARDIRGAYQVIGLAAQPQRTRLGPWRVGRVLIRTNHADNLTCIEIGFHGEWVRWEGDSDTAIPVYRR